MPAQQKLVELWSLRIRGSDLYNIERSLHDNPPGGGGHTYIQVPRVLVSDLLAFLCEPKMPPNGVPITVDVGNQARPDVPPQRLEFWSKSAGRMRIARQNRHRHSRLSAWLPAAGFPSLQSGQTTDDANKLLNELGGVHIYLARDTDGKVWAGYTKGAPTAKQQQQPFANILWGNSPGGYWKHEESK
jgi:hypothetical protein